MQLKEILRTRFGPAPQTPPEAEPLAAMAARASCRRFRNAPVPLATIHTLAAVALSAPTKSDLQQRDILIVTDPTLRAALDAACATQTWLPKAPHLIVFLANHRRQQRLSARHAIPFANDHADAPFNAAMDAAIAMSAFVTAAEALGLGCCPVSAIRNNPEEVARALALPDLVFPAMALALGWPDPATEPQISMRLPLSATVHENRFDDSGEEAAIAAYDTAREARQPYAAQRFPARFGTGEPYGWSEDKARQYAEPERTSFGQWLRQIGFSLD